MEIEIKGGNCVTVTFNKLVIVIDPKFSSANLKDVKVSLSTQPDFNAVTGLETIVIDGPGEYEVGGVSINGIAARAYGDGRDVPPAATIYKIYTDEFGVAVLGQTATDLSEEQLEAIGVVDVTILPIGGPSTMSAGEATQVARKIDSKIVVPTYVDEQEVQAFITQLGAKTESTNKLKLKPGVILEGQSVYLLDDSAK
jgi:L-ascorbate metabolism protein UlaG (beta-lactamase superfamily)